jgi:hypothetical protein
MFGTGWYELDYTSNDSTDIRFSTGTYAILTQLPIHNSNPQYTAVRLHDSFYGGRVWLSTSSDASTVSASYGSFGFCIGSLLIDQIYYFRIKYSEF